MTDMSDQMVVGFHGTAVALHGIVYVTVARHVGGSGAGERTVVM